jgi:hypothetical protein
MGGACGGIQIAFEQFTVSGIIRPGSGRKLPRGLRRSCRGLPLVDGAHGGKEPGGGPLRALSRKDCAGLGPTVCASGSLRTAVAGHIETTDVSHSHDSGTEVHGDRPLGAAVACRTTDDSHGSGTEVRGDRPLRAAVACRTTDDSHGSGTEVHGDRPLRTAACRTGTTDVSPSRGSGTEVRGDRPLRPAVAGRTGTTDVSHSRGSGTGVHGDRRYGAEKNTEEGGTEDRSARATGKRLLEPVQIFCRGSL